MTTKYIEAGDTIDYTNGGGSTIAANSVVVVGGMICIAHDDIPAGSTGVLHSTGVFEAPKVAAADIAQGTRVMWDVSAGAFDDSAATPAAGDITLGATAWAAAAVNATTVLVKLEGQAGVIN